MTHSDHSWLTHYYYDGVLAQPPGYTINTGARRLYLRSSILSLFIRLSTFSPIHVPKGLMPCKAYDNIYIYIYVEFSCDTSMYFFSVSHLINQLFN